MPRVCFVRLLTVLSCGLVAACTAQQPGVDTLATPAAPSIQTADKGDSGGVNDDVRRILIAAGLDPANPSKPKEIKKTLAGLAQVRWRGKSYGTALIRPSGHTVSFADPSAVAGLLASGRARADLARLLSGRVVNIDSAGCSAESRKEKRFRKKFGVTGGCVKPTGDLWVDFDRRSMTAEIGMRERLAAAVAASPGTPQTRLASLKPDERKIEAAISLLSPQPIAPSLGDLQPVAAPLVPAAMPSPAGGLKVPPTRTLNPPVQGPDLFATSPAPPEAPGAGDDTEPGAAADMRTAYVAAPRSEASAKNYIYAPRFTAAPAQGGSVRVLSGAYEAPPSGSFGYR